MREDVLYYTIRSSAKTAAEARQQVEQLQQIALGIQPFEKVGEIMEFVGDDADWDKYEEDSHEANILIYASRIIEFDDLELTIEADHVIAFPAALSDDVVAYFGLAHHPAIYEDLEVPTGLEGWSWEGECCVDFNDSDKKYVCIAYTLLNARLDGLLETWDSRTCPDMDQVVTDFTEFNTRLRSSFKVVEQEDGSIRFDISGPELERLDDEDGGQT